MTISSPEDGSDNPLAQNDAVTSLNILAAYDTPPTPLEQLITNFELAQQSFFGACIDYSNKPSYPNYRKATLSKSSFIGNLSETFYAILASCTNMEQQVGTLIHWGSAQEAKRITFFSSLIGQEYQENVSFTAERRAAYYEALECTDNKEGTLSNLPDTVTGLTELFELQYDADISQLYDHLILTPRGKYYWLRCQAGKLAKDRLLPTAGEVGKIALGTAIGVAIGSRLKKD
jgi:hypothetical protein